MMSNIKELDKFSRYFVFKGVQIIVQSRLGQRIATKCNSKGNDWFNIAINDIKDVNEQTRKCTDVSVDKDSPNKFTVKSDWRICCEISLKTNEGDSMVLEYWYFTNLSLNEQDNSHSPTLSGPSFAIFDIYNRMSLLLKSLITITRATPAYKLSSRGQSAESYVVCYRVYRCEVDDNLLNKKSDKDCFTAEIKLGAIKSLCNELNISFAYRTDMTLDGSKISEDKNTIPRSPQLLPLKNDHFTREERRKKLEEQRDVNKPLRAAFATVSSSTTSLPLLPEAPFSSLLIRGDSNEFLHKKTSKMPPKSEPISIPEKEKKEIIGTSSVYSSSGDSFVFVELKAPFAPDEQHELGSFFNGPSPTFTNSGDNVNELFELSSQIAAIELNAEQFDSFVDSVCCQPDEIKEEEEETEVSEDKKK